MTIRSLLAKLRGKTPERHRAAAERQDVVQWVQGCLMVWTESSHRWDRIGQWPCVPSQNSSGTSAEFTAAFEAASSYIAGPAKDRFNWTAMWRAGQLEKLVKEVARLPATVQHLLPRHVQSIIDFGPGMEEIREVYRTHGHASLENTLQGTAAAYMRYRDAWVQVSRAYGLSDDEIFGR